MSNELETQDTLSNSSLNSILPLKPASLTDKVLTIFWAENFNKALDKDIGGGAIDITSMMAFQENLEGAITVNLTKTKSKDLEIFLS